MSPLTPTELSGNGAEAAQSGISWEANPRPDVDATVTLTLMLGRTAADGTVTTFGSVPISRQIKSRELQSGMEGDDVSMLQTALRSLGQSEEAGKPGYAGLPVQITRNFGIDTNRAVNRLRYHDEIGKTEITTSDEDRDKARRIDLTNNTLTTVDEAVLAKISVHWRDYLHAFEVYPTFAFIKPSKDNALQNTQAIQDEYNNVWLERGVQELALAYTDNFVRDAQSCVSAASCHDARRILLDAWIKQEAAAGHWGYKSRHANDLPFSVVLGGADERGSIGFSQMQSRHKYGNDTATGVFQEINLYHPAEAIQGFAIFSNNIDLYPFGGGGFFAAFQALDTDRESSHISASYPISPVEMYPRLAPAHLQNLAYTDEASARLSKALMAYNQGNRPELRRNIWPEILRQYHQDYTAINNYTGNIKVIKGIKYALDIKNSANLLTDAQGNALRRWTWRVKVITTGADGICQTTKQGNDEQILSVGSGKMDSQNQLIPYSVAIIAGFPLTTGSDETLDTSVSGQNDDQIKTIEVEYSEADWHNGQSWIEAVQQTTGGN